ncbi:MAG: coproporphyrinogen dehydrogenase HemZ, partial [Oscillospiraceae bacterium]|nr:coproporphyrinogen dehydrogenase HemZ [Oscillospiraceae bacterium]
FENVGWAKKGKESLYNIVIMEELCTIIAAGGGASTKLVDASSGRIERIFDYKYPKEYIEGAYKTLADKDKIIAFYREAGK